MTTIAWDTILELLPSILNTPDLPCVQTFRYINNCEVRLGSCGTSGIVAEMQTDHTSCRKHLRPTVLEAVMNATGLVELLEAYEALKDAVPDDVAFPTIKRYFLFLAHPCNADGTPGDTGSSVAYPCNADGTPGDTGSSVAYKIKTIEELNERVTNAALHLEGLHTIDEITHEPSGRNPIVKALASYKARKQYNELANKNLQLLLDI